MSIFREYDIRGIVDTELNEESVTKIGYALSKRVKGDFVAVGYDARVHSPRLFEYLANGFNMGGKVVLNMGMVPTPLNYFSNYLTFDIESKSISPSASVMITGSHNPKEYNGFKITIDKKPFFGDDIYSLGAEVESMELPANFTKRVYQIDVINPYTEYIVNQFKDLKSLDKKIVYDCGNGVAGVVLPKIFEKLNIDAKGIYIEPDGNFPNHHPDPSVEENLNDIKKELKKGADIGFAYDGDADRIAVLTHKYNIKGDQMALLFSLLMDKPTVIGEVKCSQIMYDKLKERGAKGVMYKTGHSNLKVKIKELDADLACEVSGHIFFNDRYFGFDDALYATFRILELINRGIDLDAELDSLPQLYATEEIKVKTTEEEKFKIIDKLKELLQNPPSNFPKIIDIIDIDGVRVIFEDGWGLVRASNTTPVLVTRFEATTKELANHYQEQLNNLIDMAKESI